MQIIVSLNVKFNPTVPGLQIIFQNLSDMMSGKNKIPSDIYENLSDINFCF